MLPFRYKGILQAWFGKCTFFIHAVEAARPYFQQKVPGPGFKISEHSYTTWIHFNPSAHQKQVLPVKSWSKLLLHEEQQIQSFLPTFKALINWHGCTIVVDIDLTSRFINPRVPWNSSWNLVSMNTINEVHAVCNTRLYIGQTPKHPQNNKNWLYVLNPRHLYLRLLHHHQNCSNQFS